MQNDPTTTVPESDPVRETVRVSYERLETLAEDAPLQPMMYLALGSQPRTAHPYCVYDDIEAQPRFYAASLRNTAAPARAAAGRIHAGEYERVIAVGMGTSEFSAQACADGFHTLAGLVAEWDDAFELVTQWPRYDWPRCVVLGSSGSGNTTETIEAVRLARERGACTLALTTMAGGRLERTAETTICTGFGYNTAGVDTFVYTTRPLVSHLIALELGLLRGEPAETLEAVRRQLYALSDAAAATLAGTEAKVKALARRYAGTSAFIVCGTGANWSTARESALKINEMNHLPAQAMTPGRHLHGALGFSDSGVVTICFVPAAPGPGYERMRDVLEVARLCGSPTLAIALEDDRDVSRLADDVVRIPGAWHELLTPMLYALPMQLLAYWIALERGFNPDCQRSNIPRYVHAWLRAFPPGTH